MTIRVGTDIVYIPRIAALVERFGKRFIERVYTYGEQQYCGYNPKAITRATVNKLAGRWAAKEAVVKALGTGWQGVGYTDVEICRHESGIPFVVLHNNAAAIVAAWGQGRQEQEKSEQQVDIESFNSPVPQQHSTHLSSTLPKGASHNQVLSTQANFPTGSSPCPSTSPHSLLSTPEWQLSLSHDKDYAIATAIFVLL